MTRELPIRHRHIFLHAQLARDVIIRNREEALSLARGPKRPAAGQEPMENRQDLPLDGTAPVSQHRTVMSGTYP